MAEQFSFDATSGTHGAIIHKKTFDIDTSLNQARALRDQNCEVPVGISDSYLAARVPMWLITEWLKEAGVKWSDPAAKDVVMRNVQDRNNQKLRVWGGKF